MKLVFVHGKPAVGKLTVARELAALSGYRLFHNHLTVDLVGAVFAFGSKAFIHLREEIWLATFREAALHDTSLIFTFAPEATVPATFVPKTIALVEALGGQVVFVELTCAESELERRLVDPARRAFTKLDSVEVFRQLKSGGAFDFPTIPSDLTIENTEVPAKVVAVQILNYLDGHSRQ